MSALNCIRLSDAAVVCTDAAVYDAEGVIWRIAPKAMSMPHLRAVMATRGPALTTPIFAIELGGCYRTFDALVAGVEKDFATLCEKHADTLSEDENPRIEMLLAGWSDERDRPESYMICSGDADVVPAELIGAAIEPLSMKLMELPADMYSPAIPRDVLDRSGLMFGEVNVQVDLLFRAALELQRDIRHSNGPGHLARLVGGFGLIHVVTKEGVNERVICRWDDHLGEPIDIAATDWAAWRCANNWSTRGQAYANEQHRRAQNS